MAKAGKNKGKNNNRIPGAALIDRILLLEDQKKMTPNLARKFGSLNLLRVRNQNKVHQEVIDLFDKVNYMLEPYIRGEKVAHNGIPPKQEELIKFFSKLYNVQSSPKWVPVKWVREKNNAYEFSIEGQNYAFEEKIPLFWNGDFGVRVRHRNWNEVKPVYNEQRYKTLFNYFQLSEALLEKKVGAVGFCQPDLVRETDRLPIVHVNNFCLFIQGQIYNNWKGDFKIKNLTSNGKSAFVKPISNSFKKRIVELFPQYYEEKYGKSTK